MLPGARGCAVVLCDARGDPLLWIGDGFVDRVAAQAYLDGGFGGDACFERVRASQIVHCDGALCVAPLLGGDGVIGMLRVGIDGDLDRSVLTTIAAFVSIRIAVLGLEVEDTRSLGALTTRQREVAELVAHGCTNIEIARMLSISPNAVKKHVSRVLAMLDVSNRTELAALTGRWRPPSGIDQSLPGSVQVVLRNPPKAQAPETPDDVA